MMLWQASEENGWGYQVRARRADEDGEQGIWEQVSWESDWKKEESEENAWESVSVRAM